MLPKKQRLSVALFNAFFTRGRRLHGRYCTVVYTPHDTFKAAVVVGKKVYKKAVDRNRLRRQLYATVYNWHTAAATTGVYQVLVKPAAKDATIASIRAELAALLAEASGDG